MSETPQDLQTEEDNRRRFHRVKFRCEAQLNQGEKHWDIDLLDISLQGALLVALSDEQPSNQEDTTLTLVLDDEASIIMEGKIAHQKEHYLGFACHNIDLESMQHLRRLIELNVGDSSLVERDLESMVATHNQS